MSDSNPAAGGPSAFHAGQPTEAGIYDYLIGGSHHTVADREAAERVMEFTPEAKYAALQNRGFLRRAVTYLARRGVDQYLDLGSGFPAHGQVHEIAAGIIPDPHVVYVDRDPVVVERSREMVCDLPNVDIVAGDLRHPWDILDHPTVNRLIDWSRPVAVQLVAILHFIPDENEAYEIVATLREHMRPGSYLVLSHGTGDENFDAAEVASKEWANTRSTVTLRPADQIERFFAGFELVGPGLVTTVEWGTNAPPPVNQAHLLCAIARRP
ncbi:MAG TPA: SAM-dependent methyltransferase [Streptosporangiaceae bacterium]